MTFSNNPILCTVLFLSILTYLGALNYLIAYLRRVYTMTWVELGEFNFLDPPRHLNGLIEWYIAGFRTLGFALFGSRYKAVQDRRLTYLIWLVRASFSLGVAIILVFTASNLIQRH
jgi:hypothetical protein